MSERHREVSQHSEVAIYLGYLLILGWGQEAEDTAKDLDSENMNNLQITEMAFAIYLYKHFTLSFCFFNDFQYNELLAIGKKKFHFSFWFVKFIMQRKA